MMRFLAAASLALFSSPLRAEQGTILSWQDCVALASRKSPDLGAARSSVEASRATYRGSYNELLPSLSLTNGYSNSKGFDPATSSHWSAAGTLSVDLLSMKGVADIRAASANLSEAQASLLQASSELRFNLRQAFAQLLFAEQNIEVSRAILAMRRKSAELVNLRYGSGRESKGNRMRSQAQRLQAEAELAQSLRSLRTAQKELDRQLGLDDFSTVAATGTLEAGPSPALPADADMDAMAATRPDVALQQAVVRAVEASVGQARSTIWPSLSASYARTRFGNAEFPSSRYSWSVSGLLSLPVFGGGPTSVYYAVIAANRNLEKAREGLRSARDQARSDLENAWAAFAGADDQVRVQAALLEAARQRNDEADVRYASGLLTYDNWEIIASDRINSERQSIQARLNAVQAEAAWNRARGLALGE